MYKISYTGDGVESEFIFGFPFFQIADVCIAINNEIQSNTLYSINPNENMNGGKIIFTTPPVNNVAIDIFRKIHLDRFIDYQTTARLDVERLNDDFNFLLEAFRDLNQKDLDVAAWQNIHDNVLREITYTKKLIEDKIGGEDVLGLYNNLLSVLVNALPQLINDYGQITDGTATTDDYGVLNG